jgi:Glycosyltransferase family 87
MADEHSKSLATVHCSPPPPPLLSLKRIALVGTVCLTLLVPWFLCSSIYIPLGPDFLQDYCAARLWHSGVSIFGSDLEPSCGGVKTFHPPAYTLLVLPLALLPYPVAAWIWNILLMIGTAGLLFCAVGTLKPLSTASLTRLVFFPLWSPVIESYGLGALSPLLALGISLIIAWEGAGDTQRRQGVLLGLLWAVKMFPGLLVLHFLINYRWRALRWSVLVFLFINLVTIFLFGIHDVRHYFMEMVPLDVKEWGGFPPNGSIIGVLSTLFLKNRLSTPLVESELLYHILIIGLPITLFFVLTRALWRMRFEAPKVSLSLCVVASLLLSPITWPNYLLIATTPIILAYEFALPSQRSTLLTAALLGAVPSSDLLRSLLSWTGTPLSISLALFTKTTFLSLALIFAILVQISVRVASPVTRSQTQ